jgi:carbon-monoxide dehydrogenase large subunit
VARDLYAAVDASTLVVPRIEAQQPVLDPRQAASGGDSLFRDIGSNVVVRLSETHGPRAADWPVSVSVEVKNQRLAATPIEPIGLLAVPGDDPVLDVWCGHQAPHRLRSNLAIALRLSEDQIRVRVPSVGGAFGLKGIFHPEYAVVAALARRLGRPVLWLADRAEELLGASHGRGQTGRITLSGETSGRVHRASIEILADLGAYPHAGSDLVMGTRLMATGPYDIRELDIEATAVVTNRAPIGPYRGAGRPEAAFLLERGIDAFARGVGLDPAAVRRLNFLSPDSMPRRTPTGALYDGGDYAAALDRALELAHSKAVRREQAERRLDGSDPIGLGIGMYMDRCGGDIDGSEYAKVEITVSGRAIVRTGSAASGQGHSMILRQVVADALTFPIERVDVVAGDTRTIARGSGTFGSRSTQLGAAAARQAALAVAMRARAAAAQLMEAHEADLELADGAFGVAGVPSSRLSLADVAGQLAGSGETLAADCDFAPGAFTYPYGAFVAVVEVDIATGTVRVRDLVTVNDCGNVLNPVLAGAQVVGSAIQGLGQARLEGIEYSDTGQLLTSTLMDYLLPTATDTPNVHVDWLVTPAPSNPLGAKGIGESGCIGVPQAIVNATLDALAPFGVEHLEMPLQPSTVWAAITRATSAAAATARS